MRVEATIICYSCLYFSFFLSFIPAHISPLFSDNTKTEEM